MQSETLKAVFTFHQLTSSSQLAATLVMPFWLIVALEQILEMLWNEVSVTGLDDLRWCVHSNAKIKLKFKYVIIIVNLLVTCSDIVLFYWKRRNATRGEILPELLN